MKFLIFLPILIGIGGSLLCPYQLKGRVVDGNREPVKGLLVYHFRSGQAVWTDDSGCFELPGSILNDSVQIGTESRKCVITHANERGWLPVNWPY